MRSHAEFDQVQNVSRGLASGSNAALTVVKPGIVF